MKFEAYTAVETNLLTPSSSNQAVGSSENLELEQNYMALHFRRRDITVLCIGMIPIIKGKAIPLQAWTGPEGSRRLRLPDFKTIGT